MADVGESNARRLNDLASVGPATWRISRCSGSIDGPTGALRGAELYHRLCAVTGERHDPCCEDVFRCAIAQARDPFLRTEQKKWWYWTRVRKTRTASHGY